MKVRVGVASVLLGLVVAASVEASPITYDLSFTPSANNPSALLSGTITTDGTIGSIGLGNIIGWSFTQSGVDPFTISSGGGNAHLGCTYGICDGFSTTPTTLSFNFAAPNQQIVQFDNFGVFWVQFHNGPLSTTQPSYVATSNFNPFFQAIYDDTGDPTLNVIGVASAVPVPEPGTLVLLGLGLSVSSARRRRSVKASNGQSAETLGVSRHA